jgi:predicted CopG family antitoxin
MKIHMHILMSPAVLLALMPGKNVALRKEVVDLLDREKRSGESYSDIVLRLARGGRPLLSVVEALEALPPVEDDQLTRHVQQVRRAARRDKPRRASL